MRTNCLLLPMFNRPHQRSSKSQPLYLVMNSYWSLDSRDSVSSAGYSPINKPKFTMPSDESKHTAIKETKPQAPCYPLLNCTWRVQGLSKAPIPRVSKYRTSQLNLNCVKYESGTNHFISSVPQLCRQPHQQEDPWVR